MIESYSFNDFLGIGEEKALLILVQEEDEIYHQVKLSRDKFEKVCKIINEAKIGFKITVFNELYSVEQVD